MTPFLARVLDALAGQDRKEVARRLGMTGNALTRLAKKDRGELVEVDRDQMWAELLGMVDAQLAKVLSVREELNRKLAADRKKRLLRRAAIRGR